MPRRIPKAIPSVSIADIWDYTTRILTDPDSYKADVSGIASIIADIGVFPTANYATLAAYVEDVRSRLLAIVADTVAITWGDITAIIADIGVFPTANYATLAAYVEDIRTRLITIQTQTDKLAGSEAAATFSYLDVGGEQVMFTITTIARKKLHSIFIDLNTLTKDTTIRVKHKIDGINYRTIESINWSFATDDKGVYFNKSLAINQDLQVTMQEVADEGAVRAIPYCYILEDME